MIRSIIENIAKVIDAFLQALPWIWSLAFLGFALYKEEWILVGLATLLVALTQALFPNPIKYFTRIGESI